MGHRMVIGHAGHSGCASAHATRPADTATPASVVRNLGIDVEVILTQPRYPVYAV